MFLFLPGRNCAAGGSRGVEGRYGSSIASPILRSAISRHSAAVNIFPFSRSRINELIAGALFPIARAPRWESSGEVTIGLERRGREKEPVDFPLYTRANQGLVFLQPQLYKPADGF
jgi:hypothetical protein